jgi:hypothetical protein
MSALDTCASTKAGVGPVLVSDVLFATCRVQHDLGSPVPDDDGRFRKVADVAVSAWLPL